MNFKFKRKSCFVGSLAVSILYFLTPPLHAQSGSVFFKDLNSIDLEIDITGAGSNCGVTKDDVRSSVGYILANSPLKKIDSQSSDTLYLSFIAIEVSNKGDMSVGCAVATTAELWRYVNYRGSNKIVTVWSNAYLNVSGNKVEMRDSIRNRVERIAKDFVVKVMDQR